MYTGKEKIMKFYIFFVKCNEKIENDIEVYQECMRNEEELLVEE